MALWYQGENNCFECAAAGPGNEQPENGCGNSLDGTGYACYFEQLVSTWRETWSAMRGTTDAAFPIGVASLASQEGFCGGGWMRIAQGGGTGLLPTTALPNTFLAQGFDAAEPSDPNGWPGHERSCACMAIN